MVDTKHKILESAERLIAEQGYNATSLRQVIGDAGVNLASVHYHFGSKEELLDALVMRKAGPVNAKRLLLLEAIVKEAAGSAVSVEKVLEAFLMPMADAANENPQFVRLMGRIVAEGLLPSVIQKNFHDVLERFTQVLRQSLPHLSDKEFQWRFLFMQGAMAHTMCGVAGGDFRERMSYLIRFLAGALRAPSGEAK